MKISIAAILLSFSLTSLQAINIGYLASDFGFPVSMDRFQWKELEQTGRTILKYNPPGHSFPGEWIGVSLVAIERSQLPDPCLNRMRLEFQLGAVELDLYVMKRDSSRKLLRIGTTDLPAFSLSNSEFILEYNGLYRKYGDRHVQKVGGPILRSSKVQRRIDLLFMELDPETPPSRDRFESLLLNDSDVILRPSAWEKRRRQFKAQAAESRD